MPGDRDSRRRLFDALARSDEYPVIVRRVAEAAVPALADIALLDLCLPGGGLQRVHVICAPALAAHAEPLHAFTPDAAPSLPGPRAAATGEPVLVVPCDDALLHRTAASPDQLQILRAVAPTSWLAVPLRAAGRTIGVLQLLHTTTSGRRHGERATAAAAELAIVGGLAIAHAEVVCRRELVEARGGRRRHDGDERRRLAVESAAIGTWDHDVTVGTLRWDARCKALHGLPPEAPVDLERFRAIVHADDLARVDAAIGRALDPASGGDFDVEYRAIGVEDGVERWLHATGQAFFDEAGAPMRLIGTVLDVGARKRAEAELEAARLAAEEASRAKDEFLAMLGHELRNPLAPIQTALELMRLRDPGAFARERATVERQVTHLCRLVDDLLDVSRITRGKIELKRQPVDLADAITHAIEMVSPLLEKQGHRLSCDLAPGLRVEGDEARLAQVVSNLLTNAAKYTEPGGRIELAARVADDTIELAVRDDGIGIAPELLPRVFEQFVQGERKRDRAEGGLGLGLAITRSLVEAHGGVVRAASAGPGLGSTFTVHLPRLAGDGDGIDDRVTVRLDSQQMIRAGTRILIVDDNREAADVLGEALAANGFRTCVAYDAPQALDRAVSFRPDVAVLDIGLPVMDGYELARRLREQQATRRIKLVAITGYGRDSDRDQSEEAGFAAHLVKPVELQRVTEVLDRLVTGS